MPSVELYPGTADECTSWKRTKFWKEMIWCDLSDLWNYISMPRSMLEITGRDAALVHGWRTGTSLVGQKWRWKCPWYDLVVTMIWLRGPPTGLVALAHCFMESQQREDRKAWAGHVLFLPPQCWHIQAGWGSPIAPGAGCMAGACWLQRTRQTHCPWSMRFAKNILYGSMHPRSSILLSWSKVFGVHLP